MTDGQQSRHLSRRGILGSAIALGVGAAGLTRAAEASVARAAESAAPDIAGCGTWGARLPSKPVTVLGSRPWKVLVHHTSSPNSPDGSSSHAFALARSIQDSHLARGWIDSGQHFTVSRGGHVMEGRHRSLEALWSGTSVVEGAHAPGQNSIAIGIENEGNYSADEPPSALYARLVDLTAYVCGQYGIRPYQIYGHRDFTSTDCPGDRLYARLPRLRAEVAARIGGDPTAPVWPVLNPGATGDAVRSLQYLLRQRGPGPSLSVNGVYDAATRDAVRAFQSGVSAVADGIAGNQTWNQLVLPLGKGSSGDAVRAVQSRLAALGSGTAVDGAFGPATEAALKSFQSSHSLLADGAADARTWSVLVG